MGEYFSLLSFLEIEILLHQTILRNNIIHNILMDRTNRYCKILFDTWYISQKVNYISYVIWHRNYFQLSLFYER